METAHDPGALQGLGRAVLLAEGHQPGHLLLRDLDLLTAKGREADIGNLVLECRLRHGGVWTIAETTGKEGGQELRSGGGRISEVVEEKFRSYPGTQNIRGPDVMWSNAQITECSRRKAVRTPRLKSSYRSFQKSSTFSPLTPFTTVSARREMQISEAPGCTGLSMLK
jgi:hypothetical protein